MVIKEILSLTISKLKSNGNDNPIFEAHQIVRSVLKMSATDLVINHKKEISAKAAETVSDYTKRRIAGEPLQYILGIQEFMSLEFIVTPDVLIPRADTETLVEYVLNIMQNKGFSLLDIGTGTGCIPLSIAHYNRRAFVRGIDISAKAIEIAEKNKARLSLSERADFELFNIMTGIPCGKYDIITSNPPYIERSEIDMLDATVRDYEPHLALDGGEDGLDFYRRICSVAPKILNKNGILVFEIGYNQGNPVSELLKKDFADVKIIKDLCGNDRVVSGLFFG